MGLDIVEMVMDRESAFAVKIPDAKLANARSVGDLYDLVVSRLVENVNGAAVGQR